MGTWGTGPFDSDDALDLLDKLAEQDGAGRCETLGRIFRRVRDHPEDMNWAYGPGEVVAAVAVVAAALPTGGAVMQEIVGHGYEATAILVPGNDPALADAALAALLIAAGHDGAWHEGWTDPGKAQQARQTTSHLASVFYRYQNRHDQELPLES